MTTKEGKFPALDKLDEDAVREQDYLADVDVDAFLAEADAGPDDPQNDDASHGIFDSNEAIGGRIADVQDHVEERITAAVNDVLHDAKRARIVDIAVLALVALVLVIVIAVLAGCTT